MTLPRGRRGLAHYPTADKAVLAARYNALLQMKLGLQKFDILVIDPSTPLKQIHQQALSDGVRL